jgi:hypothetical protein
VSAAPAPPRFPRPAPPRRPRRGARRRRRRPHELYVARPRPSGAAAAAPGTGSRPSPSHAIHYRPRHPRHPQPLRRRRYAVHARSQLGARMLAKSPDSPRRRVRHGRLGSRSPPAPTRSSTRTSIPSCRCTRATASSRSRSSTRSGSAKTSACSRLPGVAARAALGCGSRRVPHDPAQPRLETGQGEPIKIAEMTASGFA